MSSQPIFSFKYRYYGCVDVNVYRCEEEDFYSLESENFSNSVYLFKNVAGTWIQRVSKSSWPVDPRYLKEFFEARDNYIAESILLGDDNEFEG